MLTFRKFFLVLCATVIMMLPLCVAADFLWKQRDPYTEALLKTFNARPVDVLYFGDSSISFTGTRDANKNGIDLLFQLESGLSVCSITNPGFSAVLYSEYLRLLNKTKYQPRLVIIPLNLRSFTGSSARRPAFNFPLRQIYIRYKVSDKFELYDYIRYRFFGLEERLTEIWKKQVIVYDGYNLGSLQDIQKKSHIPETLDYAPERERLYADQLATKFCYHYMASVASDDAMLGYIDEIIADLKLRNIKVLFYLTPINFQDGQKYVGDAFTRRYKKNITIIEKFINSRNAKLVNLATALDPSCFIDKRDVYEHYNDKGRSFIAKTVAREALKLLGVKK